MRPENKALPSPTGTCPKVPTEVAPETVPTRDPPAHGRLSGAVILFWSQFLVLRQTR